ncbi:MAG: LLM class flavin-dependent oxidoreductase [Sphingomonas sp.]
MSMKAYWEIDVTAEPTRAEPSVRRGWATVPRDVRPATINRYDHYAQIAQGAAQTGFDGLFIRHRHDGDDSQIVAAVIARETPGLALIPEFPASVGSAVYAAKQAVSFQRLAHGRLGWAIAPDASAGERAAAADAIDDADLAARTAEFLTVARGVHGGAGFDFAGRFFEVKGGGFTAPLDRAAFPPVFLGGSGEEAWQLSAEHADVHLFDPAPLSDLRHAIEAIDGLAKRAGRSVSFGIRQPLHARERAEDVGPTAQAAIAGDYETVAGRLAELAGVGIDHFILGASPSFEEAYRIGQFVLPRFRALARPAAARAAA